MAHRPELIFVRVKLVWRFWAIGWHWSPSRNRKYQILTIALGPVRWQFLKYDFVAVSRSQVKA